MYGALQEYFYFDVKEFVDDNISLFKCMYKPSKSLQSQSAKKNEIGRDDLLKRIFSSLMDYFLKNEGMQYLRSKSIFDTCFFTTLCSYMNDTMHVKRLSIEEFVYNHSVMDYSKIGSENYFDYRYPANNAQTAEIYRRSFLNEVNNLRKMRNRLYAEESKHIKHTRGSTIPLSSEYEWNFCYTLLNSQSDGDLQGLYKTYIRIGRLNRNINKALQMDRNSRDYHRALSDGIKKYESKLKKLDYIELVSLYKYFLSKICEDKKYYGINLYRFEKKLRAHGIINEINILFECSNEVEEERKIKMFQKLNNICFPRVYRDFSSFGDDIMGLAAKTFDVLLQSYMQAGRLIIDELVNENCFGDDWYDFFLNVTNDMAEGVFYSPDEINSYSIRTGSQEKFVKVLSAPVEMLKLQSL